MKRTILLRKAAFSAAAVVFFAAGQAVPVCLKAAANCKTLCGAALKETGGSSKLKYSSESAMDFGALTFQVRKKVKTIQYVCDDREVYSLCVIKAKNASGAKAVKKALVKYRGNNNKSNYLSDYSSEERNVFKNAVVGQKKTYVWYIAMSPKKAGNTKGQNAIIKAL